MEGFWRHLLGGWLLILLLLGRGFGCLGLAAFSFDIHHRFSEPLKKWAAGRAGFVHWSWPEKGSVGYYAALAHHDRVVRGRGLAGRGGNGPPVTFSDGNETLRIASLGFLHYSVVSLGTPNKTFLVALDTGSDLFWVPCDCISCAPTSSVLYGSNLELSMYSPSLSSTSKVVACGSSLCESHKACNRETTSCPYEVAYISQDTSSSGILVEDVLHLTTEDSIRKPVKAIIPFGCGQLQTGSFLDSAAPNGLFGLGMEKIAVPSIFSELGLTSNSFSMCFGHDGVGRITFGDNGTSDQYETAFFPQKQHPTYNVSITGLRVGRSLFNASFYAIFDSGTSFTYLTERIYTTVSESFHAQAVNQRFGPDKRIPFDYCYSVSSNKNSSLIPSVSLTMQGGSRYLVYEPIILISVQGQLIYCLAIVKSHDVDIIGQNFMTGNRIVFDRERNVLGWQKSDCYDVEGSNEFPANGEIPSGKPPTGAVDTKTYAPEAAKAPEATKAGSNGTQISTIPSSGSSSSVWTSSLRQRRALFLLLILLSAFTF